MALSFSLFPRVLFPPDLGWLVNGYPSSLAYETVNALWMNVW